MKEIERRSLYQASQVSQGFKPIQQPDITPLLRENQQRMLNEQKMFADAALQDFQAKESAMKYRHALENREAQELAQFSETLLGAAKQFEQERIENIYAETSALFYEDMAGVEAAAAEQDAAQAQLDAVKDEDAKQAAAAFQQGMPFEIVKRWRDLSGHRKDAYGKELEANVGELYRNYQEEQLASNETEIQLGDKLVRVNDPDGIAEFSGARAYTRKEFIKELGIHRLPRGLQAKAFKQMYAIDAKLDDTYETSYNIEQGTNTRLEAGADLRSGAITTAQYIEQVRATPGKKGKGLYEFSDIHKDIVELAANLSLEDPERAEAIMAEYGNLELNGRKFSEIHAGKITKYKELSETKKNQAYSRANTQRANELNDMLMAIQNAAAENPDFTQADLEKVTTDYLQRAQELGQPAVVPRALSNLWNNYSAGADKLKQIIKEQQNKELAFALSSKEIRTLPPQVQEKFLEKALLQEKARLGDLDTINKSIKSLVDKDPNVMATSGLEGRDISPIIISDIQASVRQDVINGLENNPQADPKILARDSYIKHRELFTKGVTDPTSQYYIGSEGKLFPRYFGANTADDVISRQLSRNKTANSLVNRVANEGITVLEDKLLIADSKEQLIQQRKDYMRTGRLPDSVLHLANKFNWNPFEVFNKQLKGNQVDVIETFRDAQMKTTGAFNTLKMVTRGQGNQQMVQRLTTDRWPVRSALQKVVPAKGGLQGLTAEDFRDIAYAVSAEAARGTDDEFAVAAAILNRVSDPVWPNTVREVITQPNQYEAYARGTMRDEPELVAKLQSPEGQRMIVAYLNRLQGRTDFKGTTQRHNMGPGDVLAASNGNFFHYSGQTPGSGEWTGEKPTHYRKFISP